MTQTHPTAETLWAGLDVGSTTVKLAVWSPGGDELVHSRYQRHFADQVGAARELLLEAHELFPGADFHLAACGSGGEPVARALGGHFVQEVVAGSMAIRKLYPNTRTAVELGGQDAKVLFLRVPEGGGSPAVSDMRMNGVCAGGTGAFLDQMSELLKVSPGDFAALAHEGAQVFDVSGRCGVFAKTDVQPLLNSGVKPADIALSCLHALARQVIGGLAQGMELEAPLLFLGGPFKYQTKLVEVFAERLKLGRDDLLMPEQPELVVAMGAALAIGAAFEDRPNGYKGKGALKDLTVSRDAAKTSSLEALFESPEAAARYRRERRLADLALPDYAPGDRPKIYLGIDAGSTTLKVMVTDEAGLPLHRFYANNGGKPLEVLKEALLGVRAAFAAKEAFPEILGVASTGYGEHLVAKAVHADTHSVETVAHAEAAVHCDPGASFVLDIGGQDMKAIWLHQGVITRIVLNEACSAGCGSFLETFAKTLGIPVDQIADAAFNAGRPSQLGSRCTVFMNSSVTTEQRNGKGPDDILAGLCHSVVENVFTKVVRLANLDALGPRIVVQGGTFKNDAVLRAFEKTVGKAVTRPPYPGEMGAWGAALLAKKHRETVRRGESERASSFIGLDRLDELRWETETGNVCRFCSNHCSRSVVHFAGGGSFVTGNRCERGEVLGDPKDAQIREQAKEAHARMKAVPDTAADQEALLFREPELTYYAEARGLRIGIPRVLEFWNSYPFWNAVFRSLGFTVVLSPASTFRVYEKGLSHVPSDTACLPAKLVHGHVQALLDAGVDRIFFPKVFTLPAEDKRGEGVHICAVIEGYPLVIQETNDPFGSRAIPYDSPAFYWNTHALRYRQVERYFAQTFGLDEGLVRKAIAQGDRVMAEYKDAMLEAGKRALAWAEAKGTFAVLLAGRPYHQDGFVNHDLSRHFTRLGVPVIVPDAYPLAGTDVSGVRSEILNPFHARMYAAALHGARDPRLEVAEVVSFGCGHDAVISDEMERVLREVGDKSLLILKLDEGDARGPLRIRIQSFVETVQKNRARKAQEVPRPVGELSDPFPVKFRKSDRKKMSVLVPNLAPAFGPMITAVLRREGYRTVLLAEADDRAIQLGKRFVHNDTCYPAQINVGEALRAFECGKADPKNSALAVAKNCQECRAGQYAVLARKAFDEAGYPEVPVVTSGEDTKGAHPGYHMGTRFKMRMVWGVALADCLTDMLQATRPYETRPGETDGVFRAQLALIAKELETGTRGALAAFRAAVDAFNAIPVDRSRPKSRVLVIGEILLNYHPSANRNLVAYLEGHGMEVLLPHMIPFFRSSTLRAQDQVKRGFVSNPWVKSLVAGIEERLYVKVLTAVQELSRRFVHHEAPPDIHEQASLIESFVDRTIFAGEGWLIPGEILAWAKRGVENFVIVQPFGCMPNHITGRGLVKALKKRLPDAQIQCLDYDPDSSAANVENRLLMMVLADRQRRREREAARGAETAAPVATSSQG
ncbi:MAG: 2-hydroxyacyl-CoA dehydratase [Spirochaetes bacterium]|nr:2-hydroxyacyl-CoA dehydratase [Spirochaetota bacterium]